MSSDAHSTIERPPQTLPVRVFNGVGRLLRRCGWRRPLDAEAILAAARRRAGLDDFGPLDVREPLGRLVASLEEENHLTPLGRLLVRQELVRLAAARLGVVAALRRRPEVLGLALPRPVFVLGLPRTGSTLLHRLLAQDPAARALRLHEMARPAAGPADEPRRLRRSRRSLAVFTTYFAPGLQSVHPMDAEAPEECRWLLLNTFRTLAFSQFGTVNRYLSWLDALGEDHTRRVYEDYGRQLRLLQSGRPPRRWVLKCPLHAYALNTLLELFPDACVVQTHRRLAEVIPSLCSLRLIGHGAYAEPADPRRVAAESIEHVLRLLRPALRARQAHPGRVYDVAYRDLVRDPLEAVRGIYSHFGLPLSAAAEGAVRVWLANNPQGKHGRHRYSLEQFGLDPDGIDGLFPNYPECFGLVAEPSRC
jgi:hypothetical protein